MGGHFTLDGDSREPWLLVHPRPQSHKVAISRGGDPRDYSDNESNSNSLLPLAIASPVAAATPPRHKSEIGELRANVRQLKEGQKAILMTQSRLEGNLDCVLDILSHLASPPSMSTLR